MNNHAGNYAFVGAASSASGPGAPVSVSVEQQSTQVCKISENFEKIRKIHRFALEAKAPGFYGVTNSLL